MNTKRCCLIAAYLLFVPQLVVAGVANVVESWTVEILDGPFDGEMGTGFFSYNPDALITGDEVLAPGFVSGDLKIEMTILDQMFTEEDDIDFDFFPVLSFSNFQPVAIDFIVSETGLNPVAINQPNISAILMNGELFPSNAGGYESFATTVPEPSTLCFLAASSAALFCQRGARR